MEGWSPDPEEVNEAILCHTPKSHSKSPTSSTDTTPGSPASMLWHFSIPEVDPQVKDAANKLACGMRERRRKRRRLLNNTSPSVDYLKRKYNPTLSRITSLSETFNQMGKSTDIDELVGIPDDEKENKITKMNEKDADQMGKSTDIDELVGIPDDEKENKITKMNEKDADQMGKSTDIDELVGIPDDEKENKITKMNEKDADQIGKSTVIDELVEMPDEKENKITEQNEKDAEDKNEELPTTDVASFLDDSSDNIFLGINF